VIGVGDSLLAGDSFIASTIAPTICVETAKDRVVLRFAVLPEGAELARADCGHIALPKAGGFLSGCIPKFMKNPG
jgi:hypothetical protein